MRMTRAEKKEEKMRLENIAGRMYKVTLRSSTGLYSLSLMAHDVCDAAERACRDQRAPLRAVRAVRAVGR